MELSHEPETGTLVEPSPELVALFEWADTHGVYHPKIQYPVRFSQGLIGVQATAPIGPDEDIVRVPLNLLLSSDCANNSPLPSLFSEFPSLFTDDVNADTYRFISYLMYEHSRGEESFWSPVLKTVPKEIETVADWNMEELADLQDSVLLEDAREDHAAQQRMWMRLYKALRTRPDLYPPKLHTFKDFRRWYGTITTRCFGRFRPSAIMAPVADLLNHSYAHTYYDIATEEEITRYAPGDNDYDDMPGGLDLRAHFQELGDLIGSFFNSSQVLEPEIARLKEVRRKEMEEEKWDGPFEIPNTPGTCFRMRTGKDESYSKGAQVFLYYGNYSNRQLLISFGFSIREDRFSYYSLLLPIDQLIPYPELVRRLERSIYSKVCRFKVRRQEICVDLMRVLRCLLWTPTSPSTAFSRPIDWQLELTVLQKAQSLLSAELSNFPTTISEDEELLGLKMPLRTRFAVLYRINVKEALNVQLQYIDRLVLFVGEMQQGGEVEEVKSRYAESTLAPYIAEIP